MAVWSSLRMVFRGNVPPKYLFDHQRSRFLSLTGKCSMSDHRTMPITASRFQWHKYKDVLHYYLMVGLIPVGLIIFYCNVFIGPAQLTEIPEDYVPKHWEYHKHPITRFLARYVYHNPQEDYEKYLHYLYEENEKKLMRELEKKIKAHMAERSDYQAYYYRPISGKYARISKESADQLLALEGDT